MNNTEIKKATLVNKLEKVIGSAMTVEQLKVAKRYAEIAIQKSPFRNMAEIDVVVDEWVSQRTETIRKMYCKECA